MLARTLNSAYLILPTKSDSITAMELRTPQEITLSITLKSPQKPLNQPKIILGSKSRLFPTPGLSWAYIYLLMDSEPIQSNINLATLALKGHLQSCSSTDSTEDYWNDSSETLISFDHDILSHLYTPCRLPITQLLKNWGQFR
ncbi:hypothetical protein PGT21_029205 [Puccinia graminis f. sp. tritici]|uniref:Uncharacterized protein n=1 Tax=Puccinia graminis f. sp. tritici TaxID=56615 RepID=A0A5B0PYZ1_PUCGR|nr:hypothetical protein PGT21_029205 [Puccinia graminis f. sp. tritici]